MTTSLVEQTSADALSKTGASWTCKGCGVCSRLHLQCLVDAHSTGALLCP